MSITKPNENEVKEELKNTNAKTTTIPVEETKDEEENIQVDFQDENSANQFASKQTKPSSDTTTNDGIDPHTSQEDLQKQVLDYENSKSGKLEYKDFLQFSEFIINLIDITVSTALNWFAKDTGNNAYSLPAPNKKLLIQQLALILSKYQSKFKIEFIFFMGLVVMYSGPAITAWNTRKEKIKLNPKKDTKTFKAEEKKSEEDNSSSDGKEDNSSSDGKENSSEGFRFKGKKGPKKKSSPAIK